MTQLEAVKRNMRDIIRNRVLERKRQMENANALTKNKTTKATATKGTATKGTATKGTKTNTKRMTKYRGDMDKLELVRNPQVMRSPDGGYEYFRRDGKYYDVITLEPIAWTNPNGEIILQPKKGTLKSLKRRKELNQLTKATKAKATKSVRAKPVYRGDMDNLELVRAPHLARTHGEGEEYFRKDGKYYDVITLELVARTSSR